MNHELAAALPTLLPKAIAWAEAQAEVARAIGVSLDAAGIDAARDVGVQHPDDVRVVVVDRILVPDDPDLRYAALQAGLLGPRMAA